MYISRQNWNKTKSNTQINEYVTFTYYREMWMDLWNKTYSDSTSNKQNILNNYLNLVILRIIRFLNFIFYFTYAFYWVLHLKKASFVLIVLSSFWEWRSRFICKDLLTVKVRKMEKLWWSTETELKFNGTQFVFSHLAQSIHFDGFFERKLCKTFFLSLDKFFGWTNYLNEKYFSHFVMLISIVAGKYWNFV